MWGDCASGGERGQAKEKGQGRDGRIPVSLTSTLQHSISNIESLLQNSAQNGRGGTRPSIKKWPGWNPALQKTPQLVDFCYPRGTKREETVGLGTHPAWDPPPRGDGMSGSREGEAARPAVAPYPKPGRTARPAVAPYLEPGGLEVFEGVADESAGGPAAVFGGGADIGDGLDGGLGELFGVVD